jgi:hypothetical protein
MKQARSGSGRGSSNSSSSSSELTGEGEGGRGGKRRARDQSAGEVSGYAVAKDGDAVVTITKLARKRIIVVASILPFVGRKWHGAMAEWLTAGIARKLGSQGRQSGIR